jgi:alpha 1,6-mannosyltransferase
VGWEDGIVRQFTSWTIMAKPKLPHFSLLIDDTVVALREKTKDNDDGIADLDRKMAGEVVDMTGPRRLTHNVFCSLESTFNMTIDRGSTSKLTQPNLVGDVLILPGYAFAASSNKYDRPEDVGHPLVTHHYAGKWKNEDGGEQKR